MARDNVAPGFLSGTKRFNKLMTLPNFLDYLDAPDVPTVGLWVDPDTLYPCPVPAEPSSIPLYLSWNVFGLHPELLGDIELSLDVRRGLATYRLPFKLWTGARDTSLQGS